MAKKTSLNPTSTALKTKRTPKVESVAGKTPGTVHKASNKPVTVSKANKSKKGC